jgi:hypothetical protein
MREQLMFEALGATASFKNTSAEGLAFLTKNPIDIVLSDMNREGKANEGALFAERVWQAGRRAPVVIYTGDDQAGKSVPPYVFGITNRPDELVHLVMDVLERKRG